MASLKQRIIGLCLVALLALSACANATPDEPQRVIAVGDVHGDFENFVTVLREIGVIDKRNRWSAGKTHFVQVGDILDRGPDSRLAMDLLQTLEKQAKRAGGQVYPLIGNHESMIMQNDFRYVHPGEYSAFADLRSKKRQERYYRATIKYIKTNTPEDEWPAFDKQFRQAWQTQYPLGFVERRAAFLPSGEYGKMVLSHSVIVKIERTLFVHGGLSLPYSEMPISEINTRARTELATPMNLGATALVNAEDGPLWYRGLARLPESEQNMAMVDQILENQQADRIVIAHTPVIGAILPRFDGKVVLVDAGMSAYYGGARSALLLEDGKAFVLQQGQKIPMPLKRADLISYLERVAPLTPKPQRVEQYLRKLEQEDSQIEQPANAEAATG